MTKRTVEQNNARNNGNTWRAVTIAFIALGPVYMAARWIVSAVWGV